MSGKIIIPLLVGFGVVILVLGVLVLKEGRPEEVKLVPPTAKVTVLPTQGIVKEKEKFFLEIISPIDNQTVSQSQLTVSGRTVAGADVSVNEKELRADGNGNFSAVISLEEGENPILITAGNQDGFEEKEIVVYYEK